MSIRSVVAVAAGRSEDKKVVYEGANYAGALRVGLEAATLSRRPHDASRNR